MIAGLGPYPVMKDSGVPRLGEVPGAWDVRKLRGILRRVTERNRPDLPLLSVVRERGVIRRDATSDDENRNYIPDDLRNYKVVRAGQFAINKMKAWQGSYGVAAHEGIVSPAYFVFDLAAVEGRFFHTAIRSRAYIPSFALASDGVRIGQWDLCNSRMREIPFAIPPLPEQAAIVRFLDHADRRIRRYVGAKQKLIKLLQEQKQAIIHRAVTRGLDPNVRLKPSGVEWLGDVPEHWSRVPMRQLAARGRSTFVNGPFGSDLLTTELTLSGVPVIYIRDISRGSYQRVSKAHVTADKADSLKFCNVIAGDVLVAKVGDPPGTAATYPRGEPDGIVTQDVIRIRPDTSRVIADYLVTYLNSRAGRVAVGPVVVESTRGRVSLPDLRAVPIILPTLPEQRRILDEIANVTSDIGAAAVKAQHEIELLREYRTRLIADVVTGKLDVREEAARLPQEAEELEPLDETEALGEMGGESAADDLEPESQEVEA